MFSFEHIGGKIKILAKVICWIGIISSVIGGAVMMLNGLAFENSEEVWGGILVIVVGVLVSWIGSFRLYGFGQLVENTDILAGQYRKAEVRKEWSPQEVQKVKSALREKKANKKESVVDAKINENEWIDLICPSCGETLSFTKEQIRSNPQVDCPNCGFEIDFNEIGGKS